MSTWTSSTTILPCAKGLVMVALQEPIFPVGQRIRMRTTDAPYVHMEGVIAAIEQNNISINIDMVRGHKGDAKPRGPWTVMVAGEPGLRGPAGVAGPPGPAGPAGKAMLSQIPQAGNILLTYTGVSKSKQSIGHGVKTFVMQLQEDIRFGYATGSRVRISRPFVTGQWMEGQVIYYVPGSLELSVMVDLFSGQGSYENWVVNLAGQPAPLVGWGIPYLVSEEPGDGKIVIVEDDPISAGAGQKIIKIDNMDTNGKPARSYLKCCEGKILHLAWENHLAAYLHNAGEKYTLIYGEDPTPGTQVRLSL